jgi:ribose transport system ATP-binding protein
MAEVSALCDRTTVLRDGVTVGVTETARGSEDRIVSLMLGREVAKAVAQASPRVRSDSAGAARPPALDVKNLTLGRVLQDVSFTLKAGEVLGIAALEGQGQDELFDCLAGVRRFDSGTIRADGTELRLRYPGDAIKAGLVLVPANRLQALLQQRSIRENVALPSVRSLRRWGPIDARAERARVQAAVARLQVDTRAEAEVRRLSGGNQQKVVIARWIAHGFKVLLCFDPTRGIDIGTKRQIYALVRELADAGSAVLLFTSELPEVPLACDRALVMFGGRIVNDIPANEADEPTLLRAAHGLVPRAEVAA